ncbi:hypothetical protein NPIL_90561 [Nephila pilipes]|uniref:Mutator-like transposase domain-containing protein n=1 Tax=Nephila pilipes TaxID=299642 RepID=A0A8X6NCS8_NEPPI|nr:hypothetical protein NPIL_90561 [Nephila pilipes]
MSCVEKGAEFSSMFCSIMNLPPPPTKFLKFNNTSQQAIRENYKESMAADDLEVVDENDGEIDIFVEVDGSGQKRGFPSKNGVVTVRSVDNGKVIVDKILHLSKKINHLQTTKTFLMVILIK